MNLEKLQYPIGKFEFPTQVNETDIQAWILALQLLPEELEQLTQNLTQAQLEKNYRPGGWTIRQLINHLADSHINAYCRFHLTLTEENPTIRAYNEGDWAQLADGLHGDISHSITILKGVHARLVVLLQSLKPADFERTYSHPETKQTYTLAYLLSNYAWHGKHHLAHIKLTL